MLWTKSATNLLISIAKQTQDRSFLKQIALCFPGRTTNQVYSKYVQLVNDGKIENDLNDVEE